MHGVGGASPVTSPSVQSSSGFAVNSSRRREIAPLSCASVRKPPAAKTLITGSSTSSSSGRSGGGGADGGTSCPAANAAAVCESPLPHKLA